MKRTIEILEKEFVESAEIGEKKNDMAYVSKSFKEKM